MKPKKKAPSPLVKSRRNLEKIVEDLTFSVNRLQYRVDEMNKDHEAFRRQTEFLNKSVDKFDQTIRDAVELCRIICNQQQYVSNFINRDVQSMLDKIK